MRKRTVLFSLSTIYDIIGWEIHGPFWGVGWPLATSHAHVCNILTHSKSTRGKNFRQLLNKRADAFVLNHQKMTSSYFTSDYFNNANKILKSKGKFGNCIFRNVQTIGVQCLIIWKNKSKLCIGIWTRIQSLSGKSPAIVNMTRMVCMTLI